MKATYTPPEGAQAGALSYVARPKKGYTIIVIDSNCYTSDNTSNGEPVCEVRGNIPTDLLKWAQKQARAARKRGDTVIGMMHHGVVSHFTQEATILGHFLVDDFRNVSTKLADAGMHYVFTGHQHSQDVALMRTEKGLPVPGMTGVNSGAVRTTARMSSSSASCAARSKCPGFTAPSSGR